MNKYWSKELEDLLPYVSGEQPRDRRYIKLNTNENPYPPADGILAAIQAAADDGLRLYPDPDATSLKQAIASFYGIETENVFAGNGSDEVLGFVFQAFFRQALPLVFPDITYSFYPSYCRLFDISYETFPLLGTFEIDTDTIPRKNGGIIIANPNAPTGIALDIGQITRLLERNSESVVVIDEAYVDFGASSCVPLIQQFPNLVVTQTLSKSRSLAGLRVGMAMADPALIAGIERVKNSFNAYPLDRLAIAGATAAFEDRASFELNCQRVIDARIWLSTALQGLAFQVVPSSANFILVKHPEKPAVSLYEELRQKGILVRYFNKPGIDDFIRISIGTMEDMQTLVDELRTILPAGI